ncbi:MAG: Hsp20/alpha crystallin family protein [Candidatus Giovannonibacteria bacterium]|nr:MAG: Hsp20/alpha crystallin family protein [Candidatus Giovannonibacteria bacterium]
MEKRSFFERLTGSVKVEGADGPKRASPALKEHVLPQDEEGQLTIDVWQTPEEIILQAIVGGVKLDDLDVQVTHDMVTLRGKRERQHEASANDYFYQELYWGAFSRSILLPQEVDADEAEATMKNGLLTIRLPKLDKARVAKLKVKNE